MQLILSIATLFSLSIVQAQDISLKDNNFDVTDISRLGFTKESIFKSLNTTFIKTGSSICSNRALVWAFDIKKQFSINSAKIFLFYTKKSGEVGRKTWWYHVAPIVNEKNSLWVVDRGFPSFINTPLKPIDWLYKFTGSRNCKEIRLGDDDLVSRMFVPQTFPDNTSHGTYDCYYRIMPEGYWTPSAIAKNMLKKDHDGREIIYEQNSIDEDELLLACEEASTTKLGRVFTDTKKKCEEYLNL